MKAPKALSLRSAFTLVEVMVSTVIVVVLAGILISATDLVARSFTRTSAKIEQFSEARRGFEAMTRRLAEATLNTYYDYYDDKGLPRPIFNGDSKDPNYASSRAFVPFSYGRQSELRFVSGPMDKLDPTGGSEFDRPTHGIFFQAPAGEVEDKNSLGVLDQSLNSWGYFLEIDKDTQFIPSILEKLIEPKRRSRLLEFRQPTEHNRIYWPLDATPPEQQSVDKRNWWFLQDIDKVTDRPVRVVAENVIALIIVPRLARQDELARAKKHSLSPGDKEGALSPYYWYDSLMTSNYAEEPFTTSAGATKDPSEVNPRHQLPPVVQVVMVALDEPSAARLEEQSKDKPGFDLKLEEIFEMSTNLEDDNTTPEANDGELAKLEKKLIDQRLTYRIFNTNVIIRGAKWSRAQKK